MSRTWFVPGLLAILALVGAEGTAQARGRGTGNLVINSLTNGAEVFIDGEDKGTIPLRGPIQLPVGKHTIKITKDGYTDFLDVVTIKKGADTPLDVDLLPYAGMLKVTSSEPDTRIFIDGKFAGTAPLDKELIIGPRTIMLRKAGFYEIIRKVKSIAGQTITLDFRMKQLPIGTTPYRPKPPPPPKWYEKWYVWTGVGAGVAAVTVGVVLAVVYASKNPVNDFHPDFLYSAALRSR
jgi:hypothetical protein